jgi:putative flippase GtrA
MPWPYRGIRVFASGDVSVITFGKLAASTPLPIPLPGEPITPRRQGKPRPGSLPSVPVWNSSFMPPERTEGEVVTRSVISFGSVGRLARRTVAHVCAMKDSVRGRLILFGTIGLSGFAPNLIVLFLVTEFLQINYAVAAIIATQFAISWNFLLVDQFVYRRSRSGSWYRRAGQFLTLNNMDLLLRIPVLAALVEFAKFGYMVATVVTLVMMFALRFVATDWVIYRMPQLRMGLAPAYLNGIATPTTPLVAHETNLKRITAAAEG